MHALLPREWFARASQRVDEMVMRFSAELQPWATHVARAREYGAAGAVADAVAELSRAAAERARLARARRWCEACGGSGEADTGESAMFPDGTWSTHYARCEHCAGSGLSRAEMRRVAAEVRAETVREAVLTDDDIPF